MMQPSLIIMDNATYHSRQIDKMLTQANEWQEIIDWLQGHGENVDNTLLKVQLVNILKSKKGLPKRYSTDEIAAECGHWVLRLPPHHYQYNAVSIWVQTKGYAAWNNTHPSPFYAKQDVRFIKKWMCGSNHQTLGKNCEKKPKHYGVGLGNS